jgi:hypothetical protein
MADKKKMTEAEFRAASAKGKANFESAQKGAKTRAAVKTNVAKRGSNLAALAGFAVGMSPIGRGATAAKAGVTALRGVATKMAQAKRLKGVAISNRMSMQAAKGKEYAMTGGDRINERSGMGGVLKTVERNENVRALKGFTKKEQDLMAQMTPKAKASYLKSKKLDKMGTKAFEKGRSSVPENLRRYTK